MINDKIKLRRMLSLNLFVLVLALLPGMSVKAQGNSRTFPQTGKTITGKFLDYWDMHGGLPQQGYPISGELQEKSDTDGKTYTVQYFERAVFELHPENANSSSAAPNEVLLSLLGTFLYKQKYPNGAPGKQTNTTGIVRYTPARMARPDFAGFYGSETASFMEALNERLERVIAIVKICETQLALSSHSTNASVKLLTLATVIEGTLAVISGIFGMNFTTGLFNTGDTGFIITIAVMILIIVASIILARRWL